MTDFRAFASDLLALCDERDSAEAALASARAQLDAANATIVGDATERATLQAQVAAITAQDASDQQKLADLQAAFDTYKASHPDAPPPVVPDVHEFADFATQSTGQFLAGDLVGKGSAVTTWRMKPTSNTKPANVQLALMRAGWAGQKVALSGFTLEGTDQAGVEYQGLMSKGGDGSTISDVTVTGIPGHGSAPTSTGGETFSLSLLRAGSHTLTNVVLDGRRGGTGAGIAATLFGMNYTTAGMVWNGGRANYATGGFGAALFQCGGAIVFNGVDFRLNRKAINLEQHLGGTVRFVRCDFRGTTGAPYIAQTSSLGLTVSTKVTFEDCLFDADQCVVNTYTTAANGGQNGQKDADIRRIDGGVDVTATAAKFKLTHL